MKEVFFKCTLLSDVVLNASLATEGNMTSLDYIPGSNFLGIVAAQLYKLLPPGKAYQLFHSGEVSFGDATISKRGLTSYSTPFCYVTDKLKKDPVRDKVFLHHLIDKDSPPSDEAGRKLQLRQMRGGYILSDGTLIKNVRKNFSLKSAYDRDKRTSQSGAMFGFDAIESGQEFLFSIRFEGDSEVFMNDVKGILHKKVHRLGKSKTAEYGQVEIEAVNAPLELAQFDADEYVLVYLQSNLCLFDKNGQPSYRVNQKDLGLSDGNIDWSRSQLRTYSYSQWNGQRNTTNTQRFCIAKGSVIYVEGATLTGSEPKSIGAYQAEGLGRVLFNPGFLVSKEKGLTGWVFKEEKNPSEPEPKKKPTSLLGKYLARQVEQRNSGTALSRAILEALYSEQAVFLSTISPSQWGGIRALATTAIDLGEFKVQLFDGETGYLTHGVAYDRYWGKNGDKCLKIFESIFNKYEGYGTSFFVRFAAEMAKKNRKHKQSDQC